MPGQSERHEAARTPGPIPDQFPLPFRAQFRGRSKSLPRTRRRWSRGPHTEGKRAKVAGGSAQRQHGTAYRWIVAYLPIMALLFALLGAVWIYTGFINPPPPTPAQQWTKIENKWSPVREKDRRRHRRRHPRFCQAAGGLYGLQHPDEGLARRGHGRKGLGRRSQSVSSFLDDGKPYLLVLQQVEAAKTPYDVIALTPTLTQWDTQFTNRRRPNRDRPQFGRPRARCLPGWPFRRSIRRRLPHPVRAVRPPRPAARARALRLASRPFRHRAPWHLRQAPQAEVRSVKSESTGPARRLRAATDPFGESDRYDWVRVGRYGWPSPKVRLVTVGWSLYGRVASGRTRLDCPRESMRSV